MDYPEYEPGDFDKATKATFYYAKKSKIETLNLIKTSALKYHEDFYSKIYLFVHVL